MLKELYMWAPRPVIAVVFFGKGRFRRIRDGALAADPGRLRDPSIVIESSLDDSDDFFVTLPRLNSVTVEMSENGKILASTKNPMTVCLGRRYPDLRVYVIR